ncbi:hypothetical protein Rs2_28593 [Raphanus sativus]|nr:hypothetical protein Rs2_28593 [Raphanus sativus]
MEDPENPKPVVLTYEFPRFETERGDYTTPPIEIKNDRDIELFMSVKIDCGLVELYVTVGESAVACCRMQKGEEEEGGDQDLEILDPQTLPFRGLARRGYILASETGLKKICTPEELEILRKTSRILALEVAEDEPSDKDDTGSSGHSSILMAIPMPVAVDGVIRLHDVQNLNPLSS